MRGQVEVDLVQSVFEVLRSCLHEVPDAGEGDPGLRECADLDQGDGVPGCVAPVAG